MRGLVRHGTLVPGQRESSINVEVLRPVLILIRCRERPYHLKKPSAFDEIR